MLFQQINRGGDMSNTTITQEQKNKKRLLLSDQEQNLEESLTYAEQRFTKLSQSAMEREKLWFRNQHTAKQTREVFDREHPLLITKEMLDTARQARDDLKQALFETRREINEITYTKAKPKPKIEAKKYASKSSPSKLETKAKELLLTIVRRLS